VLALLEERRNRKLPEGETRRPSIAVVPKSLIFNWVNEAAKFTPRLRVAAYHGLSRKTHLEQIDDLDLLVTTYGTLRQDVADLQDVSFDYAILDEAQAIKNPTTHAAKAVRLIQAKHRLAMTGTPIENSLSDLWSLFEFLNPGLLGRSQNFQALTKRLREEPASLDVLSRGIRPYVLRRSKEQVLTELPQKTEQTIQCELTPKERKLYDQLRNHYRQSLLGKVADDGLAKSKIHILEALLRLRQAACHPGLVNKAYLKESSTKLDTLEEQLESLLSEGHKALIFSQFTSLLSILKARLDRKKIVYEYLDGQTTKRQQCVDRFQTDEACRLFLVSLKAGGQGLNLTAADYVFILDPWWNPAVEAQAIDRAHRIGQQQPVMAYRLIAKDTVEEKILALQAQKRELADSIISEDTSILQSLSLEDLQLLLS
jgi:SNF2 family DNA or RNA helicase